MIDDDEIDALVAGTWATDCFTMQLDGSVPARVSGAGRIEQAPDGGLRFTLHACESFDPSWGLDGLARFEIGTLLPAAAYRKLVAVDEQGRRWECERVLAHPSVHIEHAGSIWRGEIHSVTAGGPGSPARQGEAVTCVSRQPVDLPGNASTRTTIEALHFRQVSSTLDRGVFQVLAVEGDVRAEHDRTTLAAHSADKLPQGLVGHLRAGLEFVLATPLEWVVIHEHGRIAETVTLFSTRTADAAVASAHLERPVAPGTNRTHPDTWQLFTQYVTYIAAHLGPGVHPVVAEMRGVLQARAGSLFAKALITSVAVESIVTQLYPSDTPREQEILEAWRARVIEMLEDSKCPKTPKVRIVRVLEQLRHPRAADALYQLAEQGVVKRSYVRVWKELRAAVTHGGTQIERNAELTYQRIATVTTLMYQIVFFAVGYRGTYRDRGMRGWPVQTYVPPSPARRE